MKGDFQMKTWKILKTGKGIIAYVNVNNKEDLLPVEIALTM